MTTMADLVSEARSLLYGTLTDELSVLDEPYLPDSGMLALRYPKRNLAAGSTVCAGLNTFHVLQVGGEGSLLTVLSRTDGGPDVPLDAGEIVRCKPRHTNWAIYREVATEITSMSSILTGLYGIKTFEAEADTVYGTYPIPDDFDATIVKVLEARYQVVGSDEWVRMTGIQYQPQNNLIRVVGDNTISSTKVQFVCAIEFKQPVDMTSDVETVCGIPANMQDIPTLGACATLALGTEGRRQQVTAQGDARRPFEVQGGANIGVSRAWSEMKTNRVNEELARLVRQYGYVVEDAVQDPSYGGMGMAGYGVWGW